MTPTEAAAALRDPYRSRTQAELDEIAAIIDTLAAQSRAMRQAPAAAYLVNPCPGHWQQAAILIERERAELYATRTHGVITELIERGA